MRKIIISITLIVLVMSGCHLFSEETEELFIATTTTTRDSGLLDFILNDFEEKNNIDLKVIVVGTGKALQLGRDGEVDVVLTHATELENQFVEEGFAQQRYDVMFNDFVVIGPKSASFDDITSKPISDDEKIGLVFKRIYESDLTFISRGDESGTHIMEKSLWTLAAIDPMEKEGYFLTGKGMGDVITMADELQGYTLSDRATFYKYQGQLALEIVLEAPDVMKNQYGVMSVNHHNKKISNKYAEDFVQWILSDETQSLIGEYGVDAYGQSLFVPNAK